MNWVLYILVLLAGAILIGVATTILLPATAAMLVAFFGGMVWGYTWTALAFELLDL